MVSSGCYTLHLTMLQAAHRGMMRGFHLSGTERGAGSFRVNSRHAGPVRGGGERPSKFGWSEAEAPPWIQAGPATGSN